MTEQNVTHKEEKDELAVAPHDVGERMMLREKGALAVAPHDVGGMRSVSETFTPSSAPLTEWELRIDALQNVLENRGDFNVHEFRRTVEAMENGVYSKLSYYERWAIAIATLCIAKGILSQHDIDERFGKPEEQASQQFVVGQKVRVRSLKHVTRWCRPHLRTPGYLFGKQGVIERFVGMMENPEVHAFGGTAARQPVYRVKFIASVLWGADHVNTGRDDAVEVEVFQNWLKEVDDGEDDKDENTAGVRHKKAKHHHDHHHQHDDHGNEEEREESHNRTHHDTHPHTHDTRSHIEQSAVEREGAPFPAQNFAEKLCAILLKKGVVTMKEILDEQRKRDGWTLSNLGARIAARAMCRPEFKTRLLKDANAALQEEFGVDMGDTTLVVVENTASTHNVVVCTLCSCYPASLMGRSPAWYKSRIYRASIVREPRTVLKESFGVHLKENTTVLVHDSTADVRVMVIPHLATTDTSENESENGSEIALAKKIHPDHLIGVAVLEGGSK